jgi:hypothetical protein
VTRRRPSVAAVPLLVALGLLGACTSTSERGIVDTPTTAVDSTPAPTTSPPTTADATTTTSPTPALDDVPSLAAELSAVEAGIRDTTATAEQLDALGRRQQLAYRVVNANVEWWPALLDAVDPVARGPLQFHMEARQAQIEHAAGKPPGDPVTMLPAWTIVDPLPADELLTDYRDAEAATGVPWQYLAAINFQETRMGRIVGVSSAGAVGPMQFLPSTWAECCTGDPTVPRDAIFGAATYLVAHGAPGDMQAALNAYNPNSAYVASVTAWAQNMQADERAFYGYHGWQVFVGTSEGTVRLPTGYSATAPIDVAAYLRDHPDDLLPRLN